MSWPMVKLGTVADINPSGPRSGEIADDVALDFVPMASVSEQGCMTVEEQRPYSEVKKGFTAFQDDDVLLAKITPCFENNKITRATVSTAYAFGSTEFHVLRSKSDLLDPKYLTYYLRQDHIRLAGERRMTGSGGQRRVPKAFLEELPIPLPPLEEQKRIAGILDQADALRRLRARALEKLNTLGQAVFQEMFGKQHSDWSEVPLTDFVADKDDIKCGPFGTQLLKSEFQTEGVPLWGIKQVNKAFSIPTHEYVSERKFRELQTYSLETNDIVMTRKGTVGNCAVYPGHLGVGVMHSDLLRVRVDQKRHNPIFLADQFHYSQKLSHQIDLISGGAIMAGINVGKLKALRAVAPPLDVQNEYASKIETVRCEANRQTASLRSCETLFVSLQSAAFQGRL